MIVQLLLLLLLLLYYIYMYIRSVIIIIIKPIRKGFRTRVHVVYATRGLESGGPCP